MPRPANTVRIVPVFLLTAVGLAGVLMVNERLSLSEAIGPGVVGSLGACLFGYSMRPAEEEQPLGRVILKRAGQITGALLFVMAGLYALSR
jgi:hypothetical protein